MQSATLANFEEKRKGRNVKHIKVGKATRIEDLSRCITSEKKRGKKLIIDCVGADSVMRACKAVAESSTELQSNGFPAIAMLISKDKPADVEVITLEVVEK